MAMVEKIKNKLRGNGFLLAVTIVLFFVLYIAGAILYGDRNFTSPQVFLNLFISNAGLIIAAVGMTFVLITGGIDISIGSVIGVVCMMLAWMMEVKHMSAVVAIILVLAFGVIFGLVQGFLVAYLKIQPFIVTLGGMFFARGLTALISSDMISIENPTFLSLANYRIYFGFITYYNNRGVAMHPYIYLSVVIALLVVAISFVILRYTKFGRAVFAVGGNEQSALLMGLNPKVTKLKVYVLNGFLASLAGFALASANEKVTTVDGKEVVQAYNNLINKKGIEHVILTSSDKTTMDIYRNRSNGSERVDFFDENGLLVDRTITTDYGATFLTLSQSETNGKYEFELLKTLPPKNAVDENKELMQKSMIDGYFQEEFVDGIYRDWKKAKIDPKTNLIKYFDESNNIYVNSSTGEVTKREIIANGKVVKTFDVENLPLSERESDEIFKIDSP